MDLSSKGMCHFIILSLAESKKRKHFNTCILYNPLQNLSTLLQYGLLGASIKEETRPRPLATEQTSLCSSHSCLPNLRRTTEFPETLKIGKQAAYQLPGAPRHSDRLLKNHLAGSAPQQGGLHHPVVSRWPFGQKEKMSPSICISVLNRATE